MSPVRVTVTETSLPPHHYLHGTPHPVVSRLFTFELSAGTAEVDQTDYGHPGKFNPCHATKVPTPRQSKTPPLVAAAESLAALM